MGSSKDKALGKLLVEVQEARVDKEPFALAGKDAFLKLELVGVGIPVLRRATEARTCTKSGVVLAQNLRLDVLPENTELQIKLVTSKGQGRVTNIAGGGIFVHDIIEAGSCNKWFKLFSPGTGGSPPQVWGRIQLMITFRSKRSATTNAGAATSSASTGVTDGTAGPSKRSGGKIGKLLLGMGAVVVAAIVVGRR